MNSIRTLLIGIATLGTVHTAIADDQVPPLLESFRNGYKAAVAEAVSPLKAKYLQDLEVLKNQASGNNDQRLLEAVEKEIRTIRGNNASIEKPVEKPVEKPAEPSGNDAEKSPREILIENTWVWENRTKKPATVRFTKDGKFTHDYFHGTYKMVSDPTRVQLFYGTYTAILTFDDKMTLFTGEERNALGSTPIVGRRKR